jgi:protein-S-isoprenylcysteine O-methyltransferase Ste14
MTVSRTRLLASLSLPLTMAGLVPSAILWKESAAGLPLQPSLFVLTVGCLLLLTGLLILVLTVKEFVTVGKGTLAPWDPPQELVVTGMYRYMRNPMISGVLMIIAGEALTFVSRGILYWLILFFAFNTVYFIFSEERRLAGRFGPKYLDYMKNVPRWIPRLSPWKPDSKK